MPGEQIIIIGAGIIGLTILHELINKTDKEIIIIAKEFPNQSKPLSTSYTSTRAGAHFRPFPSLSESDLREQQYTRRTLARFKEWAVTKPESSIKIVDGEEYFVSPNEKYLQLDKTYIEDLEEFEKIPIEDLPHGIKFGTKYKTWSLNPPIYLKFLLDEIVKSGKVRLILQELRSLKEICQEFPKLIRLINCTGMGLQYYGGYDENCFSIRGQTLLIKDPETDNYDNKTITYQLLDNKWCFVIPRPQGGIILGGTKNPHAKITDPDPSETYELLMNGANYFPDLISKTNFTPITHSRKIKDWQDVINQDNIVINVGFRPARRGGSLVGVDHSHSKILNAYGVGGMGFEVSIGIAEEICKLIRRDEFKSKL